MVRVGSERTSELIQSGNAEPFDPMGGKPMREYVLFNADRIAEDEYLISWLDEASQFAGTLPPKQKKSSNKK